MIIIKRGFAKKYPRQFECEECGSVFQVNKGEYQEVASPDGVTTGEVTYTCVCPVCDTVCGKSIAVQEDYFPRVVTQEPEPSSEETEGAE